MKILKRVLSITLLFLCAVTSAHAEGKVYTLQDAYRSAMETNESVKIAEEGVIQGESRLDQAWTYIYPRLDALGAYTLYNEVLPPDSPVVFQPYKQTSAQLVLTQPIYTGGRTLAALRLTKDLYAASKRDLAAARQDILLGASEVYYGVLKAQKFVEVSRNSLERMEHHKQVTEREAATRRTKANVSALLRANTLVSQARINLVRAEDGLKVARQRLNQVTGLPVDALIAEPPEIATPAESLDALKEAALSNREDYERARLNIEAAAENVKVVKGGHYPQLAAVATLQYLSSDPKTLLDGTTYYGGVRLQIPVFEGGLMKAEVSEARSKRRQAELARDSLRKAIETDVYSSYVDLQTNNEVLKTAMLQKEYARGNFDTVESLFSQGLVPSLNLIDAEQALLLAESEVVNATYEQQLAILRLKKSVGTLGKETP